MQKQIFREKNIERVSSPEQLQNYMRVTNPGVWMLLVAVIALLAGLIVSSTLAKLESTVSLEGEVDSETASVVMQLPMEQKELVSTGMKVRVAGKPAKVDFIYEDQEAIGVFASFDESESVPPDGVYDVEIVTETLTPISFLIN
ncbi:MAG: hypothetical protein IJ124_01930 [Clostridia bacterium]|nr:hypothetical protein [Clostridia bacterium]